MIQTLDEQSDSPYVLYQTSNGNLWSCADDISIFDTTTYTLITKLSNHTGSVYGLGVLPDGKIATGSYDEIIIWDPANNPPTLVQIIPVSQLDSLVVVNNFVIWQDTDGIMLWYDSVSGMTVANATGEAEDASRLMYSTSLNAIINSEGGASSVEVWTY